MPVIPKSRPFDCEAEVDREELFAAAVDDEVKEDDDDLFRFFELAALRALPARFSFSLLSFSERSDADEEVETFGEVFVVLLPLVVVELLLLLLMLL